MTFLKYVAEDLYNRYGNDMSNIVVIFPNRRASLFLNKELVSLASPIWVPQYTTISDLFASQSKLFVADQLKLICELYKAFVTVTKTEETLDNFFGWGQTMLSDFDDIDKSMCDAKALFSNLSALEEMTDDSYLTEKQRKTLERFFSTFRERKKDGLKERFINLWDAMAATYDTFRNNLKAQQLAYEGMMYREVAESEEISFDAQCYAFVGFNALTEVERRVFKNIKKTGRALFYWDYDTAYMPDIANDEQEYTDSPGIFIRRYLSDFPNALNKNDEIFSCLNKEKYIKFVSATTETIQAEYIPLWLKENNRIKAAHKTAIVMCDETLLPSVILNLPEEADKLNVTLGFPLGNTPVFSLIHNLADLYLFGTDAQHKRLKLRYVNKVLLHPYSKYISPESNSLCQYLNSHGIFFPKPEDLSRDDNLTMLFGINTASDENNGSGQETEQILIWMINIIKIIATSGVTEQMFQESVFRTYLVLNRLLTLYHNGDLSVTPITLVRLINNIMKSTTIPFHGEPAEGIQIMGVLETRNIDFQHLLILSCNDKKMPKGVDAQTFIPQLLRKAFNLTTTERRTAIYSYYFNSMMQRCQDITICYNNSTEGSNTGEMSRYMLQTLVDYPEKVEQYTLSSNLTMVRTMKEPIRKDSDMLERQSSRSYLSPTAINRYIACQKKFFYSNIAGIREEDNMEDDKPDARMFGNIFHLAAQMMYEELLPNGILTEEIIKNAIKDKQGLEEIVDRAFDKELYNDNEGKRHHVVSGINLLNKEIIVTYLKQLLEADLRVAPLEVKGHEKDVFNIMSVNGKNIKVGGRIDRIDIINGNQMRVVDYKTGKGEAKPQDSIDDIFDKEKIKKNHSDYFLQAMLYSIILSEDKTHNPHHLPVSPALHFIQNSANKDYVSTLKLCKEYVTDVAAYKDEFMPHIQEILAEIFDASIPFSPTEDPKTCEYCEYQNLCQSQRER